MDELNAAVRLLNLVSSFALFVAAFIAAFFYDSPDWGAFLVACAIWQHRIAYVPEAPK